MNWIKEWIHLKGWGGGGKVIAEKNWHTAHDTATQVAMPAQ